MTSEKTHDQRWIEANDVSFNSNHPTASTTAKSWEKIEQEQLLIDDLKQQLASVSESRDNFKKESDYFKQEIQVQERRYVNIELEKEQQTNKTEYYKELIVSKNNRIIALLKERKLSGALLSKLTTIAEEKVYETSI